MFNDETPQDMFNCLKKLINKAKALGSKKWTDCILTEHMMRVYTSMNYNIVALIRQNPTYKRMSSNDVLGRIMNHEMYIEEVNHVGLNGQVYPMMSSMAWTRRVLSPATLHSIIVTALVPLRH
jgi:hypothetical protein